MKRLFLTIILFCMPLAYMTACGSTASTSSPPVSTTSTAESVPEPEPEPEELFASLGGSFEDVVNGSNRAFIDALTSDRFTAEVVAEPVDIELDDMIVHASGFYGAGNTKLYGFTDKQTGEFVAWLYNVDGTGSNFNNRMNWVSGSAAAVFEELGYPGDKSPFVELWNTTADKGEAIVDGYGAKLKQESDGKTVSFIFYAKDTALDIDSLPVALPWAPEYFMADAERLEQLNKAIRAYDHDAARAMLEAFIEENTPPENDPIRRLYSMLTAEDLLALEAKITRTYDSVENTATITYTGNEKINRNTNITATIVDRTLKVYYGFQKSGWLFFDKIAISLDDGEKNITSSWNALNMERNVLSGGTIEEYNDGSRFNDEELQRIVDSGEAILRFYGDNKDNYYDHTITDTEKDALYTIHTLYDMHSEISTLLRQIENYLL